MKYFISIVSFLLLQCIPLTLSFLNPSIRRDIRCHISERNILCMSLNDEEPSKNEKKYNEMVKKSEFSNVVTFPLAKEYHNFLMKYKIITKDEIDNLLDNKSGSFLSENLKNMNLMDSNISIKIAKSRVDNYLIFEKNWNMINKFNKVDSSNIDGFKLEINKYADSIDFNSDTGKSDKLPSDLMKKEIKKNVKFSSKMLVNRIKKEFDDFQFICVLEILKGIFNITSESNVLNRLESFDPNESIAKQSNESNYIDWTKNNMTTLVKDQGQCGSCWAFSAVSTLESFMRINNRSFELLSEQELVDCSTEDYGCNGGFMDTAYDYVIENNGLHSSIDYPYTAKDGDCKSDCCNEYNDKVKSSILKNKNLELELSLKKDEKDKNLKLKEGTIVLPLSETDKENTTNPLDSNDSKDKKKSIDTQYLIDNLEYKIHRRVPGSNFRDYRFFIPESVEDIKKSLKNGPIAIALDANSFFFRFYESGVIDLPSEYSYGLNHAVMLVGFDKDEKGEHWIIQNSWGKDWGDNGFVRLRIREGQGTLLCQIYGVYPYK